MEGTKDQEKALAYWKRCSNTYLAAEEYYSKQERALKQLLNRLGYVKRAMDIGCGDGRFTMILKEHCKVVDGIDISPQLIQKAVSRIESNFDEKCINFSVNAIENFTTDISYQLVTCMGVTSGLIDTKLFKKTITKIKHLMSNNSWLIVKDTLSLKDDQINKVNDYVAIYRNMKTYKASFCDRGFLIEEAIELMQTDNDTVNIMFLLRLN